MDKSILVVEDERPLLNAIKEKLEKNGFDVVTARSVSQATGYLEDISELKAVWLDHYLLGDKNGLDFVGEIRGNKKFADLPIFVVTNTGGHEKKETYMKLGATEYYVKVNHRLDAIIKDINEHITK